MVFDPVLIVYQIISVQCLYYATMGLLLVCFHLIFGSILSLDMIFSPFNLSGDAEPDFAILIACFHIISGLLGSYVLLKVVEKTKKCLDFSITVVFIHMIACTMYEQFPVYWGWWVANGMSFLCMVLLGEYLCSQGELENIPLYTSVRQDSGSAHSDISMKPRANSPNCSNI